VPRGGPARACQAALLSAIFRSGAARVGWSRLHILEVERQQLIWLSLIESITARGSARQTRDENGKFSQADVVAQRGLPVSARRFT
jgi:hypothetical protein